MNVALQAPIRVGGFVLDLERETLTGPGGEVRLRPKTFEVLRHLLMHRGRVVTKQELIEAVWRDAAVTDDSLVQCLIEIRRALGDEEHRLIETIPRRGYMVAEGEAKAETGEPAPAARLGLGTRRLLAGLGIIAAAVLLYASGEPDTRADHGSPGGVPFVAVLPFRSLGPVPVQQHLQIGMADAVVTRLSGVQTLAVRPTSAVTPSTSRRTAIQSRSAVGCAWTTYSMRPYSSHGIESA